MSAAGSIGAVEPVFVPQKALLAVEQIETVPRLTVVGPAVGLVVVHIETLGTTVLQTMMDPVVVRTEVPGTAVLHKTVGPAEVHIEAPEAVAPMFVGFAVA
jgi:hypothetical protein